MPPCIFAEFRSHRPKSPGHCRGNRRPRRTERGRVLLFGTPLDALSPSRWTEVGAFLGLPVGRGRITAAKFLAYAGWIGGIVLLQVTGVLVLGFFLHGAPTGEVWGLSGRWCALAPLTSLVFAALTCMSWSGLRLRR